MNVFADGGKVRPLRVLAGLLLVAALVGAPVTNGQGRGGEAGAGAGAGAIDVTVILENVGSNAWIVAAVEGAEGVAETGVENPVLELEVGTRYRFVNRGGLRIHPFAIRGEDGEPVLAQRPDERPFELDPDVAFEADEEGVAFTLTEELAAVVATYYCTAHPTPLMEGRIEVRGLP